MNVVCSILPIRHRGRPNLSQRVATALRSALSVPARLLSRWYAGTAGGDCRGTGDRDMVRHITHVPSGKRRQFAA
jgi:hypothetical protein